MGHEVSRIFGPQSARERWQSRQRVQRWLEFLAAFDYTPKYREGSANRRLIFCLVCRSPQHPRRGQRYLPRPGLWVSHSLFTESRCRLEWAGAVLGGLPFASSDFRDFRAHALRMRIDDVCAPSGRCVARVSAPLSPSIAVLAGGIRFGVCGTLSGRVGVGWQRNCKTCRSLRELDYQGTVFLLFLAVAHSWWSR